MKVNENKNKFNISHLVLKRFNVAKKDFNKVYKVNYATKTASYISINKKYVFKHTITPFTTRKQFFSDNGLPQNCKISSIYNQSKYRTKEIDNHITAYRKTDKEVNIK